MNDPVVITGMGLVTPLGLTVVGTWEALLAGRCGIGPVDSHDLPADAGLTAALVTGLDPSDLRIHPRDARIMDRHAHMLMKSSRDAFAAADLPASPVEPEEIGFFAGMGMVDYRLNDLVPATLRSLDPEGALDYGLFYTRAFRDIYPLWPLSMLNNISFCQTAIDIGIKGENSVFSPHADSGSHAVIEGMNSLLEGKSRVVLAGGVSEKVSPLSIARASWAGALSSRGECRPFSNNRSGTILGEGSGMLALELLSSAKQRAVPCHAAITGYSCSFGKDDDANCPSARAMSSSMEQAVSRAGLTPGDIDLIIANGDGTVKGDRNEIEAIHDTFAGAMDGLNVYSAKGALGNLLAGAPPSEIIVAVNCIRNGIIPPVTGSSAPDRDIAFGLSVREPKRAEVRRAMVNAFSYEGQCVSLIIERIGG